MSKLIYSRMWANPLKEPMGASKLFQLRMWDDDRIELRRLGYASRPGWSLEGTLLPDRASIMWGRQPSSLDWYDVQAVHMIRTTAEDWFENYIMTLENAILDKAYEESEWGLI